jgi:hypothetical protein
VGEQGAGGGRPTEVGGEQGIGERHDRTSVVGRGAPEQPPISRRTVRPPP